jgi:hypothetical protein
MLAFKDIVYTCETEDVIEDHLSYNGSTRKMTAWMLEEVSNKNQIALSAIHKLRS